MTEPTTGGGVTVTITQDQLDALIEQRLQVVMDKVNEMIDAKIQPVLDQLAVAVKLGMKVSLKAANGQFICTEDGGPKTEKQPFTLTSRASNGVWESLEVVKGQ